MENPFRIAVIGSGKVGDFLTRALREKGITTDVYARHPGENEFPIHNFSGNAHTVTLLCVPDDHIAEVSSALPPAEGVVAHVSGATSLDAIDPKHHRRAVFYPVMSFSKGMDIRSIPSIPLCLESHSKHDLDILAKLTELLGWQVYKLNSEQRRHLHLAAVWAHNFSNHLYQLAYEELQKAELDMNILRPLLVQAVNKLGSEPPLKLQTGPAVRGDDQTIARHLDMIADEKLQDIYKKITQSIQKKHDEEL